MTKYLALALLLAGSTAFATAKKPSSLKAGASAVQMEIAKVYRTGQFVNASKPVATYATLKKSQDVTLSEAVAANEKQTAEVTIQNPKTFHVNVSPLAGDSVTVKLKSQSPVYAIRYDAQGNASQPEEFKAPMKLSMNETIELTSSLNPDRTGYSTSFRMKIVPADAKSK
ncbi:hypothetical protein BH10BDE1_BH10BDE1_12670 [soil metagenome]